MRGIWWFLGCVCAAGSSLASAYKGGETMAVYLALLTVGFWLQGIAYAIKDGGHERT